MVKGFGIHCVDCDDYFTGTIPLHLELFHEDKFKDMRRIQSEAFTKAQRIIRGKTKTA